MQMENVAFPEALALLAERAGIELHASSGPRPAGSADEKRMLYQAMAWAEQQFHECLLSDPQAEAARKYLRERQLSDASIGQFRLGFAPNEWEWLVSRAARTSFTPAMLERVGLIKRRTGGPGHYDFFKGRVLFPIYDLQNRPVGIGGRVLPEINPDDPAKYKNSPETPLFSKSKLLYGLSTARDAIRRPATRPW